MPGMAPAAAKQVVLAAIEQHIPRPTDLLEILATQLSYTEIQDAVSELLEVGTIELTSNRRLRVVKAVAAD
jgi:hypothetical protein